jgi:hypothetical protein
MLKIHDKLWYVKRTNEDLAYMTYYKEDKAFEKRKETGTSWARSSEEGVVCDNTPQEGFIVGQSVSRYFTSNKLFRVMDPRGFEVEIPTDNLAMLLQSCTITNSVVQEKCVWGREGSNHILLNEGSEPYKAAMENMDKLAHEVIKPKDHVVGDVLEDVDGDRYLYLGKFSVTYNVLMYGSGYGCRGNTKDPFHEQTIKDKPSRVYYNLCKDKENDLDWYYFRENPTTKFVTKSDVTADIEAVVAFMDTCTDEIFRWLPKRVTNKLPEHCSVGWRSYVDSYKIEHTVEVEYLEGK